jgi:hypothetical protein
MSFSFVFQHRRYNIKVNLIFLHYNDYISIYANIIVTLSENSIKIHIHYITAMAEKLFQILDKIIIILTIALCSTGIIGNFVSVLITMRKELRKTPTFIFMAFLSVINILKVITMGFSLFIFHFLVDDLNDFNYFFSVIIFFICFTYQSSSYLKVI